ncbi:hypothetical protein ROJ8625_00052 [Roseivivax jejudonensis]|uniref:Heparan-alpha-glucosaminide N-acetyltransferase catalytic domain-containing protein n=1 Tax=Roseivivax jejudonensis TaxID=1529041 RepID=A0A1X6Y2X1_9RHOB|nr:heparan-alpha-glucosaminide N-acetyltransferase [Roseivivax jejudonensis]SLN09679.1 hypothetical protein ROJ8625_00052 [Roseivivax jejudonensis]
MVTRTNPSHSDGRAAAGRVVWLDIARVCALGGMVIFHFVRDLEVFGLLAPGTTSQGAWAWIARLIAGSFVGLSGISVVLVHGRGFRVREWLRHCVTVTAAAVAVTAATFVAVPDRFVYFGILHAIATFGVLAPLWVRLSSVELVAAALAILLLHGVAGRAIFDAPWMAWTGLGRSVPPTLDLIPVVPWLAIFLIGIALGRAIGVARFDRMRTLREIPVVTVLGRHSLAVYVIHQPILLAVLWCAMALTR